MSESATSQVPDSLPPEALAYARQFFDFARKGDVEAFKAPLAAGLPANLTNEKGDTLLMLAAYNGHGACVELLLSHGADPNRLNDRQQSPLAGAVFKNEVAVIEALLAGGADPEHGNPSGMASAQIFKKEEWIAKFESAPGRGKVALAQAHAGAA